MNPLPFLLGGVGYSSIERFWVVDNSEVASLFVGATIDAFRPRFTGRGIDALVTPIKLFASATGTFSIAFLAEFPTPTTGNLCLFAFSVLVVVVLLVADWTFAFL